MIDISKKDMILPYDTQITRLLYTYDIATPLDKEIMKLYRFNIINRNLLRRLRCTIINKIWTKLHKRTDPPTLTSNTNTYDSHSPPIPLR